MYVMKIKYFILSFILLFIPSVFAITGVVPASYEVNYESYMEKDFSFSFRHDFGVENKVYIEGELGEYFDVKSVKEMSDNTLVIISMKMPKSVELAGLNKVYVCAREINSDGGINLIMDVRGLIKIRVPYPDKYADVEFNVGSANQGEKASYNLTIYSRGSQSIFVLPKLKLESDGKVVDIITLDGRELDSMGSTIYKGEISTDKYLSGNYNLTAFVDYGGDLPRTEKRLLKLGKLDINIIDYTSLFNKGKLNRIDIKIESIWNNEIDEIFVNGSVIGYPYITFESPTYNLEAWSYRVFPSHFNAVDIKENDFQIAIDVNYEGEITSQILNVSFIRETNWLLIGIIAGVIIILMLFMLVLILLLRGKK